MLTIREARSEDVAGIREVFIACYGEDYPYHEYLDEEKLRHLIYSESNILFVAEDAESHRILGTSSVVLDIGAVGDLAAEFGRLAVHPDARGLGTGGLLMKYRLDRVRDRIHVGVVENRVAHSYSQKISIKHGFVPAGFLPLKLLFSKRESMALYIQLFNDALALRNNNPYVIPEVYSIAELAMNNCGLACDAIVQEETTPYPQRNDFDIESLTTEGFTTLLRFERGRVKRREVFGPTRLHYGLFQLQARHCNYLLAYRAGQLIGGIGFLRDDIEKLVRVIELISIDDEPIHFLISSLEQRCREEWEIDYIEVDVNAHSPRIQQTFLQLGFLPAGYVPALVFHNVERLDAVKMVRLLTPTSIEQPALADSAVPIANFVIEQFRQHDIVPRIAAAMTNISLFAGMTDEQASKIAALCNVRKLAAETHLFEAGETSGNLYIVLRGVITICSNTTTKPLGFVQENEVLGETSLISSQAHSVTARCQSAGTIAELPKSELATLIHRRADIGLIFYRNLAESLGMKLRSADRLHLNSDQE